MSDRTAYDSTLGAAQFGQEIAAAGEPFTEATLQAIRALLAEADPVPQPKPLSIRFGAKDHAQRSSETDAQAPMSLSEIYAAYPALPQQEAAEEAGGSDQAVAAARGWRQIEIVEGRIGRGIRRVLMSPRMLSVGFLCGVVIWQPWFIPMLALMLVSTVLLIGALIGQDRMARILLYLLKRFVWAEPSRRALLRRLLPQRWHGVLHRPAEAPEAWDGLIDPSFEARLARIRKAHRA